MDDGEYIKRISILVKVQGRLGNRFSFIDILSIYSMYINLK